ncbi:MAG TPA: hypothetical protein VIJ95_17065 [Hanamia sp.]
MRKILFISAILFAFMLLAQNNANAQAKAPTKTVTVKAKSGSSGMNVMQPNDNKPREKSKKRGSCYVWFDNPTGYYVDVWVEDIYQGRLAPYSTSVRIDVWTPGDWTKWYAQTTGGSYYWSQNSYCDDSRTFTITL